MPRRGKGKHALRVNILQKGGFVIYLHAMKKETSIRTSLRKAAYVFACLVLACILVVAVAVLIRTFRMDTGARIDLHGYLAIGFAAFFAVFAVPRLGSNFRWLMKFTHEFTHMIFAILFFRKIQRFKVDSKESYVSYSGGWFGYHAITLSPYCVPIFTLVLLPWRFTTATDFKTYLAIIDILIGFSYAFHVCCWAKQIRLHQTDITGPGIILSLLVIAIFQLLNLSLVVLTPSSGVENAIERVFWEFPRDFILSLWG